MTSLIGLQLPQGREVIGTGLVTMSPALMPTAETSSPGPINVTTLVVGVVVSCA